MGTFFSYYLIRDLLKLWEVQTSWPLGLSNFGAFGTFTFGYGNFQSFALLATLRLSTFETFGTYGLLKTNHCKFINFNSSNLMEFRLLFKLYFHLSCTLSSPNLLVYSSLSLPNSQPSTFFCLLPSKFFLPLSMWFKQISARFCELFQN